MNVCVCVQCNLGRVGVAWARREREISKNGVCLYVGVRRLWHKLRARVVGARGERERGERRTLTATAGWLTISVWAS